MLYSQRDKKWDHVKLGTCNETIGSAGCLITIFAVLFDFTPRQVNDIMLVQKGYTRGCLVNWEMSSKIFEFKYLGYGIKKPVFYPCIAEVRIGRAKHFVLMYNDSELFDPWFGDVVKLGGRYKKIHSYRYIKIKTEKDKEVLSILSFLNFVFPRYWKKWKANKGIVLLK